MSSNSINTIQAFEILTQISHGQHHSMILYTTVTHYLFLKGKKGSKHISLPNDLTSYTVAQESYGSALFKVNNNIFLVVYITGN